jgi:hypothetical protein
VVSWCLLNNLRVANDFSSSQDLHSPARQQSFLLGLMLGTPEPSAPKPLTAERIRRIETLLNAAFEAYQLLFYPDDATTPRPSEWRRARDVAMPAFMHYVGSGVLATAEQVEARIRRNLTPFDAVLRTQLGLSASEALTIYQWLLDHLQDALARMNALEARVEQERLALLADAARSGWDALTTRGEAERRGHFALIGEVLAARDAVGTLRNSALKEQHLVHGEAFLHLLTSTRGSGAPLSYPTERTTYAARPLIARDSERTYCPSVNDVLNALLIVMEDTLLAGAQPERYLRSRDRELEREAEELFVRYFAGTATVYRGLFETPSHTFEHDLIVVVGDKCLVVEVKASPPIEPSRDPDRSFERLKQRFSSDRGIQGAFDQAQRLVVPLLRREQRVLYDGKGQQALVLDGSQMSEVFAVCFMRDDHGPLATNLSLLLDKAPDVPYPWVICAFDFASLCDAREYWLLDPSVLFEFLRERVILHGKASADDELDLFAFRLRHGSLRPILDADCDIFVVASSYSHLFDQMYHAKRAGGERVEIAVTEPVITDLKRLLQEMREGPT